VTQILDDASWSPVSMGNIFGCGGKRPIFLWSVLHKMLIITSNQAVSMVVMGALKKMQPRKLCPKMEMGMLCAGFYSS